MRHCIRNTGPASWRKPRALQMDFVFRIVLKIGKEAINRIPLFSLPPLLPPSLLSAFLRISHHPLLARSHAGAWETDDKDQPILEKLTELSRRRRQRIGLLGGLACSTPSWVALGHVGFQEPPLARTHPAQSQGCVWLPCRGEASCHHPCTLHSQSPLQSRHC